MLSETHRNFTSGFDDFHYDHIPQPDPEESPCLHQDSLSSSLDRDNELLGFQPTTYNFTLLDHSLRRVAVSLNARLHGMFFMADDVPITPSQYPPTPLQTPPELTCYRRNLFQVTGSISLPRGLRYVLPESGDRVPIMSQELVVSATESVEGHAVRLISVPWKTPVNNPPAVSEDKTEREPVTIPLDPMSCPDLDADNATFPIAWKRLQFRIATANNGRRKELQQHFIARLKLMATLSTGERIAIAETRSAAIVVRGRSPRNFQQRRDLAIGGDRASIRKGPTSPTLQRRATADDAPTKSTLKREHSGDSAFSASASYGHRASDPVRRSDNFSDWHSPIQGSSSAPAMSTPVFNATSVPSSKSPSIASPPLSQPLQQFSVTNECPHNSIATSTTTPQRRPSAQRPQKIRRTSDNRPHPYRNPSVPALSPTQTLPSTTTHSQMTTAHPPNTLYQYLPLSNDDYIPATDVIYKPHAPHHITVGAAPAIVPVVSLPGFFGTNLS